MPVLTAEGLGLRTRRGWVFRDVDLSIEAGELVAITGPAGSGRTSLLLALAGHFVTNAGSLHLDAPAALGYVPGVYEPEPGLTVAEHVTERRLLLGQVHRDLAVPDLPADVLGRELSRYQRHRLMLALATLGHPALIAADDVDVALDREERQAMWDALGKLAADGYAVVVTCRELEPTSAREAREYRVEE
jgi:ABC-2 type transport system ATP-binding protein